MNNETNMTCDNKCENMTATCPNVKPYADGSKRLLHTEVKCNDCGKSWMWGISWDGSKDGMFNCGCVLKETPEYNGSSCTSACGNDYDCPHGERFDEDREIRRSGDEELLLEAKQLTSERN